MMMTHKEKREQRAEYIENWYSIEKSVERMSAVLLIFVVALIAIFDQPSDQWTLLAITGGVAGSITLFTMSRQPRARRTALNFAKVKNQTNRSVMASIGAMILITQMGMRPLALILGGLLFIVSVWYRWRASKIERLDALFATDEEEEKPIDA